MASPPLFDCFRLKLFCLLDGPGAEVLSLILKHGTYAPAPNPPVHLDKYLASLPSSSTANYLKLKEKDKKKPFNPSELRQIQNDPLWVKFDISLLHTAIRLACEHIAGLNDDAWKDQNEMEGLIKIIKDHRNAIVHEKLQLTQKDFVDKTDELRDIFMKTLTAAKIRYNIPDSEFTPAQAKILQDIDSIKALSAIEIFKRNIRDVLPSFKEKSKIHLEGLYKNAQYFDPLSFLSGSTLGFMNIQSVFCSISLKEGSKFTTTADIDSLDLLTVTKRVTQPSTPSHGTPSTQATEPQCIMISGVAGSGKTTLLTFILSEWIKDSHMCRIPHLTEYDLVLRVICREKDGPSLQDFLQQTLPNIFGGIEDRLVALLKEIKVLFIIDGLDELSQGSSTDQLIVDILSEGKNVPGFTIIFTSRPETVHTFMAKIPGNYIRWVMEMKGISPAYRTEFVLRQYNSFQSHKPKDPEKLKYLMDRTGWKDHYGLPLNLLFVATLFFVDPDKIKETTTQTSLYVQIHEWCKEKLLDRLARQPHAGVAKLAKLDLNESINKVLRNMYQVSLQGLLKDRLYLTKDETDLLKKCCNEENLSSQEVMGAFLCLREDIVRLVSYQKYSAPHKALQEFFAAKQIVEILQEDSTGRIRHMLQDPNRRQLEKLRNLLLHVAGLLSQEDVPAMPEAMKEVVDLLASTGVKKCNDWLSLLEDTEVNSTALERVVEHIRREGDENLIMITDGTVTSAAALLPLIPTKRVEIDLNREVDVSKLHQATAGHECTRIVLWQHYKEPNLTPALDDVLRDVARSHVEYFAGHLSPSGIHSLKECNSLEDLYLALSGGPDTAQVLAALADVRPSLPKLSWLYIHVPVRAVQPEDLTRPLPPVLYGASSSVFLVVSGVEDDVLDMATDIAAKLQPENCGYWNIKFPQTNMKAEAWHRLVDKMATAGVKVEGFVGIPRTITMTDREEQDLKNITRNKMGCDLDRRSEDRLWK